MKQTKKEFRIFLITDYEKEGEYLSLRHSQGWKFVKVVFLVFTTLKNVLRRCCLPVGLQPGRTFK